MEITAFHRPLCPAVRYQTDDSSDQTSDRGANAVVFTPPGLSCAGCIRSARYNITMPDSAPAFPNTAPAFPNTAHADPAAPTPVPRGRDGP
ncbi:hypothetical protein [Streptomyces sp. NPDC093018]|uniref:hypothetical protein n=1 Tax=Streptomyces sp. NPDC093018 TaxID=3155067 RepID=UPI003413ABD0